jgi:hypothetical protein
VNQPILVAGAGPDGYVGFRSGTAETRQLAAWLDRIGATG